MNFEGKTVIVTGGSRGIGRAIALDFAKSGASVVVNYNRNAEKAEEVVKEIEAIGPKGLAVQCNVSNQEDVDGLLKATVDTFGTVDFLINNAGITKDTLILRMKENDWDAVVDTNLKGTFMTTKVIGKYMLKKKSGRIVNITSVVGLMGNAGQSNYAASKAGVVGFTKSIAKEFASRGLTVNAVAPGFIESDMTDVLSDDVKEMYSKAIPLGKMGKPEDVANAVKFLCSDMSKYITGQVIQVDGGMLM
ncbi:3-oxoacyl-[acyl-carrier-protein] reductase [Fusibacter sp. JL216-2]|uniref:3-oxoacyl-[acyl-carrier-protein] reductase n=1 Tax=Fusibacter sp. JL216-2 TaxID=3071453 RepID=UPI003D32751E